MIRDIIDVITAFLSLERRATEKRQRLLDGLIQPMYDEVVIVHADYMDMLLAAHGALVAFCDACSESANLRQQQSEGASALARLKEVMRSSVPPAYRDDPVRYLQPRAQEYLSSGDVYGLDQTQAVHRGILDSMGAEIQEAERGITYDSDSGGDAAYAAYDARRVISMMSSYEGLSAAQRESPRLIAAASERQGQLHDDLRALLSKIRQRRLKWEPLRQKLRALAIEMEASSEWPEEAEFMRSILSYLPSPLLSMNDLMREGLVYRDPETQQMVPTTYTVVSNLMDSVLSIMEGPDDVAPEFVAHLVNHGAVQRRIAEHREGLSLVSERYARIRARLR